MPWRPLLLFAIREVAATRTHKACPVSHTRPRQGSVQEAAALARPPVRFSPGMIRYYPYTKQARSVILPPAPELPAARSLVAMPPAKEFACSADFNRRRSGDRLAAWRTLSASARVTPSNRPRFMAPHAPSPSIAARYKNGTSRNREMRETMIFTTPFRIASTFC